ncbi:MAG: hypothetical protein ACRD21_17250 [Vicinamibacteria bacterium]
MIQVSYVHELDYLRDSVTGDPFPGLWIVVRSLNDGRELEIQAHLDSGAERSLFDGQIARAIGLQAGNEERIYFRSTVGVDVVAVSHRVQLVHENLGERELAVGFSDREIARNLLGRDFFDLYQIGFREHSSKVLFSQEER